MKYRFVAPLSSSLFLLSLSLACATIDVDDAWYDDGDGDAPASGGTVGGGTDTGGANMGTGGNTPAAGGSMMSTGGGDGSGTGGGNGAGGSDAAGGATASGGAAGTGGGSPGGCTPVTCAGGSGTLDIGTTPVCFEVSGAVGGWQVSSDMGCSITLNGSPIMANGTLAAGELAFSGCSLSYSAWSCW